MLKKNLGKKMSAISDSISTYGAACENSCSTTCHCVSSAMTYTTTLNVNQENYEYYEPIIKVVSGA